MRFPWQRRREIDEELATHLRMAIEARIAGGEPRAAAERAARAEFGNALLVRETTEDVWAWLRLERFARDFRYALRQIRRARGFATVAILTLALGLGATTAMFSIVNSVLLEPLQYRDPGQLFSVVELGRASLGYWVINARHFHEWRAHCRSCQDVALALTFSNVTLTGSGDPVRFPALSVSSNFFRTLGVSPAMGRDFQPAEELPGHNHEIILSDPVWRSQFAADAQVIGREVIINGSPYTVIGVMPPDFRLPVGNQWGPAILNGTNSPQPAVFVPFGIDVSQARGDGNYNYVCVVRLKPGAHPESTAAELQSLVLDFVREFNIGLKPKLLPLKETVTQGARAGLWLLFAAVGAVLLIVCVNIGNLMLVRTAGRDCEAGVRMALGASCGELFRLVLSEAAILVAAGGAFGIALGYAGLKWFVASAPLELPRTGEIHMDLRALLFSAAAAVCAMLICGLAPAWKLSRTNPQESLKSGSLNFTAQRGRLRMRSALVGAEVALSALLLVIGGLLLLSFYRLMRVPKGFEIAHVITQSVNSGGPQTSDADRLRFVDEALRRLAETPGAQAVGVTSQLPLRGESWLCDLQDFGPPKTPAVGLANFRFVSPGYWTAMGIPLKRGRFLEPTDRGRHTAVISEGAARLLWPGEDPIGKHVGGCENSDSPQGQEVVGVVGDVRAGLEKQPPLTVYQGHWRESSSSRAFVVRTQIEPANMIAAMRRVLRSLNAGLAFPPAATMEQIMDDETAPRRFEMELAMAFALAAVLLAALGVYGVIAFTVARRTPEIGIRIALGARAPELAALVLREGMTPVIAGLAAGLGGALLTGRFIASQLFGVAPNDPWTISAVALVLLSVAAGACWIPARRAMKIDPLIALRFE